MHWAELISVSISPLLNPWGIYISTGLEIMMLRTELRWTAVWVGVAAQLLPEEYHDDSFFWGVAHCVMLGNRCVAELHKLTAVPTLVTCSWSTRVRSFVSISVRFLFYDMAVNNERCVEFPKKVLLCAYKGLLLYPRSLLRIRVQRNTRFILSAWSKQEISVYTARCNNFVFILLQRVCLYLRYHY